ncbi:hypothetical protein BLNAU_7505 [Blattamonas nauphoetae]|uniref:Uncharacterized protein n=1 Tax=Blattamonas nauphoetae TaxID=2049346 RepID=A0ABQ9Y1J2_9EUKA|nr:hypothetical protein BLNAU_7505 [Blattamonas nauphoetae]
MPEDVCWFLSVSIPVLEGSCPAGCFICSERRVVTDETAEAIRSECRPRWNLTRHCRHPSKVYIVQSNQVPQHHPVRHISSSPISFAIGQQPSFDNVHRVFHSHLSKKDLHRLALFSIAHVLF